MNVQELTRKVIDGYRITKEEAMDLYREDLEILQEGADQIRKHFMADSFDICTIVNAKSGKCSEDCKFCAQSSHYATDAPVYGLKSVDEIVEDAIEQSKYNLHHYGIVTGGKKLSDQEVNQVCNIVREIKKNVDVDVCLSGGLLSKENFQKLYDAGVRTVHNNLETSASYFPELCTTHTQEEKIQAIKDAEEVGMRVCSGGIFSIGEEREDRIDMAMQLRDLNIYSVNINVLKAIPGTPFEGRTELPLEELLYTIAIYRFIIPDRFIRFSAGRPHYEEEGNAAFKSGANACISGSLLTIQGIDPDADNEYLRSIGYAL